LHALTHRLVVGLGIGSGLGKLTEVMLPTRWYERVHTMQGREQEKGIEVQKKMSKLRCKKKCPN
jgi:hypothetical protein